MAAENWQDVCATSDIPEDDVIAQTVGDQEIALYEVEGSYFATDNLCTHGQARLSEGFLEDGEIECPLHQGRFCVKSGKAMCAPLTEDIRAYPVKISGDRVWVDLG
ncbi:MAG: non-heme iron oxygenase ferredoxin subunit [Natronospirillum sp.]|uniref:non-heme iron oxygenase ferredoxin subunit n=1 Tax=Natronospirillum sp. TaxID=2812955 RepID=UPI0025D66850|nr:non-heme iron oxygenase ferredoxin subunit [Natronospirillum sp.]MCH8551920.1 non-heme iron oxygenase ferredoxin subunit [Natronospirillum sp.]